MKRKRIRKILIIAFSVCFVAANVTSFTYAVDPVTFTEAETLGATIVDLYGAYNNTSLAYEQLSGSGALTEVITLYNNYASNASDPYTLAAIGAAAAAAGAIAVIYDAVTGQGYVQLYQEQYISSMDGYWDYQLTDVGLVRDSLTGLFSWTLNQNDSVDPITIYRFELFPNIPVVTDNYLALRNNGLVFLNKNNGTYPYYLGASNNTFYAAYVHQYDEYYRLYCIQEEQSGSCYYTYADRTSNSYIYSNWLTNNPDVIYGGYYGNFSINSGDLVNSGIPTFESSSDMYNAFIGRSTYDKSIDIEPSTYIGDPLQNPLEITVPDPTNPDYNPQPARIKTNIPWDPDWGTPVENPVPGVAYPVTDPEILNDAVPGIWESIVSDGVEVGDPDPEPEDPGADANEVTIPFLPITLPSFNLNLSGIWHYVVTWVGSLGDWFTTLFAIWSVLPYAMVVPVYATLVVVIVLGVYRRFLT